MAPEPVVDPVISMDAPPPPERSEELHALLDELRPRILALLATYGVPETRAAEMVHDTFIALAVRWSKVGNRKAWLLSTLEARCRAYADDAELRAVEARAARRGGDRGDPGEEEEA